MRLWLKDDERLPDPPPLKTDDRAAFLIGTVLWIVAVVVATVFASTLRAHDDAWVVAMTLVGVGAGLVGLVYAQIRRARLQRARLQRARAGRARRR